MAEPFGSLDAQTREILQDELLRIYQRGSSDAAGRKAPPAMVFITHSIEESIALGDRIVVLSSRPATIREVLTVDIPRPRTVASVIAHPRFVELRDRCSRLLRENASSAPRIRRPPPPRPRTGRWRFAYNALGPLVSAFYSVPAVALIPLIGFIFKFQGDAPRVAAVALFCVFPVLINTQQGVRNVDRGLLEVARAFNTSERRLWTDWILPSSLPYMLAGIRLAIRPGLLGTIVPALF